MPTKLIRLAILVAALTASVATYSATIASASSYCDPLGGCKHALKLSPTTVTAGKSVKVSGNGCKKSSTVTIYSHAFKGATRHSFAGAPAVYTKASRKGSFSVKVTIKRAIRHSSYNVGGRCGGGNLGSARLKVK